MNNTHHTVSFSGGICSFWAAYRVIQKHGTENVTLLFADTLMEDEDLYRFNAEAEQFLGVNITVIKDGRTPWEVFEDENMMGNSRVDMCLRILKRELLEKWHKTNCNPENTVIYVGLDWTESHRLDRLRLRKPKWRIEAPMCDAPYWDKRRMQKELADLGITPPRLYSMGFPHNNCGGFCVKAGQAHFAHLLKMMPERYAQHEANEKAMRERLGKDVSILKQRIKGDSKPLTLEALRKRVESNMQIELLDWGGCGCAIDSEIE